MNDLFFLTSDFWISVINTSTPVLFATLGAVVASKSGAINIAIEGIMLFGAFFGVLFSAWFHSVTIGILLAIVMGMLISTIIAFFTLKLGANMIITGIAINIISLGGTRFLLEIFTGESGMSTSLKSGVIPDATFLEKLPLPEGVGHFFGSINLLTYLALFIIVLMHIFFEKTGLGLRIKAVGEAPDAAESLGINVNKVRYIALLLSGAFAVLGGVFLSMRTVSWFSAGMTDGRGYIALAARAMASDTSIGSLLASLLFGTAASASNYLTKSKIPSEIVLMIPYAVTIIGFILVSIFKAKRELERKKRISNN